MFEVCARPGLEQLVEHKDLEHLRSAVACRELGCLSGAGGSAFSVSSVAPEQEV